MKQTITTVVLVVAVGTIVFGLVGTDIGRYALAMIVGSVQAVTQ